MKDSEFQHEENIALMLELAKHVIQIIRFDSENVQQCVAVCLFARTIELGYACKSLIDTNKFVGVPLLVRSMIEADWSLTNVLRVPDFWKRMQAKFLDEKLRHIKNVIENPDNPGFIEIRTGRDMDKELCETKAELARIAQGKKPLSAFCNAYLAGRIDEYTTAYASCCLDSHNNIASLEESHIDRTDNREKLIVLFKKGKEDVVEEMFTISAILYREARAISSFFRLSDINFDKYSEIFQ